MNMETYHLENMSQINLMSFELLKTDKNIPYFLAVLPSYLDNYYHM